LDVLPVGGWVQVLDGQVSDIDIACDWEGLRIGKEVGILRWNICRIGAISILYTFKKTGSQRNVVLRIGVGGFGRIGVWSVCLI